MDYRLCRGPVPAVPKAYQADQARHGKLREAKGGKVSWACVGLNTLKLESSQTSGTPSNLCILQPGGEWMLAGEIWTYRYRGRQHSTESFFILPGRRQLVCKHSKSQNWGRLHSFLPSVADISVPVHPPLGSMHRHHTGSRCSIAIVAVARTIPPHQSPTKNCANWPKQRQNGSWHSFFSHGTMWQGANRGNKSNKNKAQCFTFKANVTLSRFVSKFSAVSLLLMSYLCSKTAAKGITASWNQNLTNICCKLDRFCTLIKINITFNWLAFLDSLLIRLHRPLKKKKKCPRALVLWIPTNSVIKMMHKVFAVTRTVKFPVK